LREPHSDLQGYRFTGLLVYKFYCKAGFVRAVVPWFLWLTPEVSTLLPMKQICFSVIWEVSLVPMLNVSVEKRVNILATVIWRAC